VAARWAWIGDANNMASLAAGGGGARLQVHVSTPPNYALDPAQAHHGPHFEVFASPIDATRGADL